MSEMRHSGNRARVRCSRGAARPRRTEKLTVRLDWTPWGVHAAHPSRRSRKAGSSRPASTCELEDGNGSVTTVQLVGAGLFDVGHASLAPMMIARDKGLPVRAIANFARKSDIGLLVPRGAASRRRSDLAGKKLIFTAGSLEAPFLDAFLAAGGLKREQVELLNVEAAAKAPTYAASARRRRVLDGAVRPAGRSRRRGRRTRSCSPTTDSQFPSFGLLSSDDKLKATRPGDRGSFASIVAGAWHYILAGHEDEAVQAIIAQRPQAKLDAKVLRGQIDVAARPFFTTPASKGHADRRDGRRGLVAGGQDAGLGAS